MSSERQNHTSEVADALNSPRTGQRSQKGGLVDVGAHTRGGVSFATLVGLIGQLSHLNILKER